MNGETILVEISEAKDYGTLQEFKDRGSNEKVKPPKEEG